MRIILADDHTIVREILRQYLELLGEVLEIDEAGGLDEVLSLAKAGHAHDLILLDLQMPGMDGVRSIADVRRSFPNAPIVIISANADSDTISTALRNGANGYIPKTTHGKSLVMALRLVLDGETYVPPALLDQRTNSVSPTLSGSALAADLPGAFAKLSAREVAVLKLLISGKSNKEIARELDLQEVTVKVHLRNVYRKIKATNRTDAVRIALSQGGLESWLGVSEQKTDAS